MKINIPADWLISKANLEEGHEIGAGSPRLTNRRGKHACSTAPTITDISQHVSFGRFVTLMRRQNNLTVERLAEAAEVSVEELLVIEHDPHHEPELSTVFGLAKSFRLPPKNLMKMAGLAEGSRPACARDRPRDEPRDELISGRSARAGGRPSSRCRRSSTR